MKAKLLVQHINSLIPESSEGVLKEIFESMKILPEMHQTAFNDELSFLINNFQMEGVEIGMFRFFGKYKVTNNYYLFCDLDMDYMGFDKHTREIVLLDHDTDNIIIMNCAKNSTSFLALLSSYSEFIIHGLLENKVIKRDFNKLYEVAGGGKYKNFVDYLFVSPSSWRKS